MAQEWRPEERVGAPEHRPQRDQDDGKAVGEPAHGDQNRSWAGVDSPAAPHPPRLMASADRTASASAGAAATRRKVRFDIVLSAIRRISRATPRWALAALTSLVLGA